MTTLADYVKKLETGSYSHVIGADECGYGCWAGSLYVCAAAVTPGWHHSKLDDSKKLNAAKREEAFYWLKANPAIRFEIATATVEEINRDGLGVALKRCYRDVLTKLQGEFPEALVVIDGEVQVPDLEYLHFPKADGLVPAVMAASIYGKVLRDRYMVELAAKYPGYGLGDHMGYGTPAHEKALKEKGMTPEHRNYTPMTRILTGKRGKKVVEFDDNVERD